MGGGGDPSRVTGVDGGEVGNLRVSVRVRVR